MPRVLICGSREWPNVDAAAVARRCVDDVIAGLPDGTIVVHGGAYKGVDQWAGEIATRRGLFVARLEIGPQHYKRWGNFAPVKRDYAMLDLLQPRQARRVFNDYVVAVQYGRSAGTQRTVDDALRRGIYVELHRFVMSPAAGGLAQVAV